MQVGDDVFDVDDWGIEFQALKQRLGKRNGEKNAKKGDHSCDLGS
jgi:hypothetical protein